MVARLSFHEVPFSHMREASKKYADGWSNLPAVFAILLLGCAVLLHPAGALAGSGAVNEGRRALVRFVPDGDTVVLASGEVVRLLGIDAPEMGKDGAVNQFHAEESRQALANMVAEKEILVMEGNPPRDRYGRTLAQLFLPQGESIAKILVSEGHAMVYWHADVPKAYWGDLLELQRKALKAREGMWQAVDTISRRGDAFVGNRKSKRLFTSGCDGANSISKKNIVEF
ncbi:MAG: thermonuclease family protein, partial [Halodesulfovibrio sp.]